MTFSEAEPSVRAMSENFFSLTPDRVLAAVERTGQPTTGLCYALNSLENRVYEVELEDRQRVVAKFYRPGRWSREAIAEEHLLLAALYEHEIPVCRPLAFDDGSTLKQTEDGIFFTVFPRVGGRCPDELIGDQYEQLGRLLGRIHNVSAATPAKDRPTISPQTYGLQCLATIEELGELSPSIRARYADAVHRLVELCQPWFADSAAQWVHGDCHRANLLFGNEGWFFLDFDDSAIAPPVQDMWLLLPARAKDCPVELESLLRGYEQFRSFDHGTLRLIEALRALRYVRYAAWVCARWDDPSFSKAFPDWGSERYWEQQISDLHEQLGVLIG